MKFPLQPLYNWYTATLRNPKYRWWIILGTLVYFLSPLDISPDIVPIVGQIDDVLLLTLLVTEVSQMGFDYLNQRKRQPTTDETEGETIDVDAVSID